MIIYLVMLVPALMQWGMLHSFSQALSTVLVCRLVLSLRKEGERRSRRQAFNDGPALSYRDTGPGTNQSDGMVLTSCAISSFFNVDLGSEPSNYEADQDPPSVPVDTLDVEQDLESPNDMDLFHMIEVGERIEPHVGLSGSIHANSA